MESNGPDGRPDRVEPAPPRALTGAMVGSNLAVAGAILQAVMRNPHSGPHIIRISAGAGITGIAVLVLFPAMTYLMTPVAFLGAIAAAGAIYALAWKNGIKPVADYFWPA